jgi:hypothetical protein
VAASSIGCAVAQDPALERHPLVDREAAVGDLGEDPVELAGLRLRQEADLAEVDAEDRDVDLRDRPHRAEEGPVATEDDQSIGGRQLADEDSWSPDWACHWSMLRIWHQPAARALSSMAASIVGL